MIEQIQQGDKKALNRLIKSNLRFVIHIACQYRGQGVSLSDLISSGNIGIIKAAERFKQTDGIRFIKYAVWWIRQHILYCMAKSSRSVNLPRYRIWYLHQGNKVIRRLEQKYKRSVDEDEVNNAVPKRENINVDRPYTPVSFESFNEPTHIEGVSKIDLFIDKKTLNIEDDIETKDTANVIYTLINELPNREKDIIIRYFGLHDCIPETLKEIGNTYGVSLQRIQQIIEITLNRLKHKTLKHGNKPILSELV